MLPIMHDVARILRISAYRYNVQSSAVPCEFQLSYLRPLVTRPDCMGTNQLRYNEILHLTTDRKLSA